MDQQALLCSISGILSSSAFVGMNTTINYITMPTLLLGHLPQAKSQADSNRSSSNTGTISHLNRQWQEVYNRGHLVGPALAVLGGISYGSAAYFVEEAIAKRVFGAAAVSMIAVVPYTLLFMVPTNNELHERANAAGKGSSTAHSDKQSTLDLVLKWVSMSKTRANIAFVSVCLGLAGLYLGQTS